MEPLHQKPDVSDLLYLINALMGWSSYGFNKFSGSGIIPTLVEYANDRPSRREFIEVLSFVGGHGHKYGDPVSVDQVKDLLSKYKFESKKSFQFFSQMIKDISFHWSWFEENKMDWEKLDEIRERLGLVRINPVFVSRSTKIVLRVVDVDCKCLRNPPEGYRFVGVEEAGFSDEFIKTNKVVFNEVCRDAPAGYFHYKVYVPVIKL